MTRWSPGRLHGRPRPTSTSGRRSRDQVPTDRLPAVPPVVGAPEVGSRHTRAGDSPFHQSAAGPRPRTAPLQVVHGRGPGRGPDRWTLRAGELLDQHLQQLITRDQLLVRLVRQVWAHTWPHPTPAAGRRLRVVLATHGPALLERAAWYAAVEADVDRCAQCRPHQSCPMHLRQLRTYWDALHTAAALIAHPPTTAPTSLPTPGARP